MWCLYIRNEFLYTGSDDKTIKVWNLNTFDCIHTIQQNKKVLSLAVSEDYICAGTDDCKIQVLFFHF